MECIRNLAGPLCPVCRYNHDSVSASVCSEVHRLSQSQDVIIDRIMLGH